MASSAGPDILGGTSVYAAFKSPGGNSRRLVGEARTCSGAVSGCARAALFLHVSTGKHAQSDLSILDQRRLWFSRGSSRRAQL
jgi:hypothetical protein